MTQQTCETCRFCSYPMPYAPRDQSIVGTPTSFKCRRRAPVATGGMMSSSHTIWPTVAASDWCGEHQPKQEPTP